MENAHRDEIAARVGAVLEQRGLGPDALSVIDNLVAHNSPVPPPFAPALVREILAHPLKATDTQSLFDRAVPGSLVRLVHEISGAATSRKDEIQIRDLLAPYLADLEAAQLHLRGAVRGTGIEASAVLAELRSDLPSPGMLRAVAAVLDEAALGRANDAFLVATARFIRALRAAEGRIRFPDSGERFATPVGVVSIGTRGDDVHDPDTAVIVDPGGNDCYLRAPVTGGAISVVVDLAGNDRMSGSDVVVHGFSAVIDLQGDDHYAMDGPGQGATIAGVSLLLDFAGDDIYEATRFSQGAAAFGLGALIDVSGDDTYRMQAGGQGFGLAGGTGLLWDRGGHDRYHAAGPRDALGRGGAVSFAQGAALGYRTMLGGGFGILRDDAGDDLYDAQMFAQAVGYYYGAGLLWDRGGNDQYTAVRYAQGNGVHEAVGVLRDEAGNDSFLLSVGVGQGMGLDLAVGLLWDGAGDDMYEAGSLAQGAATANGIGIAIDAGGTNRWRVGSTPNAWGQAEWARGLPSLGFLLYDPAHARFERGSEEINPASGRAELAGPLGGEPVAHEPPRALHCPQASDARGAMQVPLARALLQISPGFIPGGSADPGLVAHVLQRLTTQFAASIAEVPADNFEALLSFADALRCALRASDTRQAAMIWNGIESLLGKEPASAFAGPFAGALRVREPPAAQMRRILEQLDQHPRCSVRTAALSLRATSADENLRTTALSAARTALRSSCWQLQAQALTVLKRFGISTADGMRLPSVLLPPGARGP